MCLCAMLGLFGGGKVSAQPIIQLTPSQNVYLGNTLVDVNLSLFDLQNIPVNFHTLEFDINSSTGSFAPGAQFSIVANWANQVKLDGGGGIGGQTPIHIKIASLDTSNIISYGKIGTMLCIISIDDLQIKNPGCTPVTISVNNIKLIEKIDKTTPTITPLDKVTLLANAQTQTSICPKCEITDLKVDFLCNYNDDTQHSATISFTGESPTQQYQITSTLNNNNTSFVGGTGSYTFDNIPQATQASIVVTNINTNTECSIPIWYDCALPIILPTCNDGLKNGTETDIDCSDDSNAPCPSCSPCNIEAYLNTICTGATTYEVTVNFTADAGFYNISSAGYNMLTYPGSPVTLGPFAKNITANILIKKQGGTCSRSYTANYQNCNTCNTAPANDFCINALALNLGYNGPYNNYCATHTTTEKPTANLNCAPTEPLTNTVWYKIVGTGTPLTIWAEKCTPSATDYENDLQMAVFTNCNATNQIACSNDAIGLQPSVTFNTTINQTYYILIDGVGHFDPTGEFCLSVCQAFESNINNIKQLTCPSTPQGAATVSTIGGVSPFIYTWSNGTNTPTINNLLSGIYTVTITDAQGCKTTNSVSITTAPTALKADMQIMQQGNNGGISPFNNTQVQIQISGGTPPYTFLQNTNGFVKLGFQTNKFDILYADIATWAVTVIDQQNCQLVFNNNHVLQDSLMDITKYDIINTIANNTTGSIDITILGGTLPYHYNWSNGATTQDINALGTGWYSVIVTDSSTPNPQYTEGWYWVAQKRPGRGLNDIDNTLPQATNPQIILYPSLLNNKNNNILNVLFKTPKNEPQANLTLYNLNGQVLDNKHYKNENNIPSTTHKIQYLPPQNLKAGMYIVEFKTQNSTQKQKIMILE